VEWLQRRGVQPAAFRIRTTAGGASTPTARLAMLAVEGPAELFARLEGAVAFRLFADRDDPTLTVPEQVAAQIGDRIISGRIAPGARIVEQELAVEFRVSRGPIRDAIRILEREGLATIQARRGAVEIDQLDAHVRVAVTVKRARLTERSRPWSCVTKAFLT
jgi:DNA-binding transcriptional regulator YhcF (GntR family)